MTRVFVVDPDAPEPEPIAFAADTLRAGRLVAFPTETVYGLGANALDGAAIQRIYVAKERPASDPVIVHIHTLMQLEMLVTNIPALAHELAARFWPGPLTLVLPRAKNVPEAVSIHTQTVAVRMPSHPIALALLRAADLPVAAPSANRFSRPSATTAAHVLEDLGGRVDVVLDGGAATMGLESTIVDLTGSQPTVLRPGGVLLESLRAIDPTFMLRSRFLDVDDASQAPGQLIKHYSPRAVLRLFSGDSADVLDAIRKELTAQLASGQQVGLLMPDEECNLYSDLNIRIVNIGSCNNLEEIGHNLFARIRQLDAMGVNVIVTHTFPRDGLGAAIYDRLVRAAEGRIIHV